MPVERFLLSIVLHPNDDESIHTSFFLLWTLLKNFSQLSQRIKNICDFAPLHSNILASKSDEFFKANSDHHNNKFKSYSYLEWLMQINISNGSLQQDLEKSNSHSLPVFYGNLADRIVPVSINFFVTCIVVYFRSLTFYFNEHWKFLLSLIFLTRL